MNYQEFRQKIPKITVPQTGNALIEGIDSIHWIIKIGTVYKENYTIDIPEKTMLDFVEIIDLLDKRGAKNGQDYIVAGEKRPTSLTLGIHTTRIFLSDEDFDFRQGVLYKWQ